MFKKFFSDIIHEKILKLGFQKKNFSIHVEPN